MWTVLLPAALFLVFTATPSLAVDQIVYPTGLFPTDVQNVQVALDAGGTIQLKATDPAGVPTAFNFGPPAPGSGRVFIRRDVALLGETRGSHTTTIRGGNLPVRGFVPVRSEIRGIHFDGPRGVGLLIAASTGLTIGANKITQPTAIPVGPFTQASGIHLESIDAGAFSGTILIEDNVIQQADADKGNGIELLLLDAAARITGNEIRGATTNGILLSGNTQPVWIERNLVVPGQEGFPNNGGNGIFVNNFFQLLPQAPVYISHNTVICDNPLADGILLFEMEGVVIAHNHVIMRDVLFGGISLFDDVSNTYVGQNQVEGAGAYALDIFFTGQGAPVDRFNTFVGNNISGFRSTLADVFLDATAEEAVLVGNSGTIIDLGSNNRITGFTQLSPGSGLGQQIHEASERKRELLQELQSVNWPDDFSK